MHIIVDYLMSMYTANPASNNRCNSTVHWMPDLRQPSPSYFRRYRCQTPGRLAANLAPPLNR